MEVHQTKVTLPYSNLIVKVTRPDGATVDQLGMNTSRLTGYFNPTLMESVINAGKQFRNSDSFILCLLHWNKIFQ